MEKKYRQFEVIGPHPVEFVEPFNPNTTPVLLKRGRATIYHGSHMIVPKGTKVSIYVNRENTVESDTEIEDDFVLSEDVSVVMIDTLPNGDKFTKVARAKPKTAKRVKPKKKRKVLIKKTKPKKRR